MGREYRILLPELALRARDGLWREKAGWQERDPHLVQLAIAERLEAIAEILEEKLTQIAQNLARPEKR